MFVELMEMMVDVSYRCHPEDTVEIDVPVVEGDDFVGARRLAVQCVERHGHVVIVFGSGRPLTPRGG